MASDVTITSLTAVGGLGQIAVTAMASSPAGMTCLAYMQPSSIDIYSSATDTWSSASNVGTINSAVGVFIHGGLSDNVTRYYWAVPRDLDGNEGARYPSTMAGVSATTKTAQPGPGSVGTTELANGAVTEQKIANLAVTNAKIASLSADKLTAGTVTVTVTFSSPIINGGTVRTAVSGARVEMSGANNQLRVYSSAGAVLGSLGDPTGGIGVINVDTRSHVIAGLVVGASFQSQLSGTIGSLLACGMFQDHGTGRALAASATGSGAHAHCIAAVNQSGGGGVVGVSNPSGGYAFLATAGSYGPFTGAHDAFVAKDHSVEIGDIVCDVRVLARNGVSDTITEVAASNTQAMRTAAGIVAARVPFDAESIIPALPPMTSGEPSWLRHWLAARFDRLTINGVGEGQVNVCGRNGDIAAGDYITTSTMHGKGQRQDDDIKRSCTVARAREAVSFSHPDQVKRVACFYECG